MTAALEKLAQAVDKVARLASILFVLTVLSVMCAQVFFRYVLNSSLQWSEELSVWAMIWLVFVGSVVLIHDWEHIFIPTLVRKIPLTARIRLIVFSRVLSLVFLCLMAWYGWQVFTGPANAFSHNVGISTAWAKLSVPVGAVAMAVMVIALIARDLAELRAGNLVRFENYGEMISGDVDRPAQPER